MDRLYYLDSNVALGDVITTVQSIRLYDGDVKVMSVNER